jgi:bacillithiol system protein YtxJ
VTAEALHSLDAYEAALRTHARVLLFKHSPVCPISAAARAEYERFLAAHPAVPALFVDVIADRAVARGLAERCGVAHQSPQAIVFAAGVPVWHQSHGAITATALAQAWNAL